MTEHRTAEERIALWLEEEAAGQIPDYVLDATFDRTRAIHHRPGPSAWRPFTMSRPISALIAVGAAAIVLALAVVVLRPPFRSAQIGGPGASPSESARPSHTPLADCPTSNLSALKGCMLAVKGPFLAPFSIAISTDEEWRLELVTDRQAHLDRALGGTVDVIVVEEIATNPCTPGAPQGPWKPWAPTSPSSAPAELAAALKAGDPVGTTFGDPYPSNLGTASDVMLDGYAAPGDLKACGGFITITDSHSPGGAFGMPEGLRVQFRITEVSGRTIVIAIAGEKPILPLLQSAGPMVDSIIFESL